MKEHIHWYILNPKDGTELVLIPGGWFWMGSGDDDTELRLPKEAEWELVARGYQPLKYPWGGNWEDGKWVCWDRQRGPEGETSPVFDHADGVSPFGTFQQSGNVWEWCEDSWENMLTKPPWPKTTGKA